TVSLQRCQVVGCNQSLYLVRRHVTQRLRAGGTAAGRGGAKLTGETTVGRGGPKRRAGVRAAVHAAIDAAVHAAVEIVATPGVRFWAAKTTALAETIAETNGAAVVGIAATGRRSRHGKFRSRSRCARRR